MSPFGDKIATLDADAAADANFFVDTAAVMMNLDLVITCDTSVAHLAGALGRPVFTALPVVADWRWLVRRDDTALVSDHAAGPAGRHAAMAAGDGPHRRGGAPAGRRPCAFTNPPIDAHNAAGRRDRVGGNQRQARIFP